MSRKAIPDDVQNSILTKSRRRCCLCFWLDGRDEVQKGQIAHLDQNNENAEEDNLAFLCFDHHDEYDGVPRLAKGLREREVRHWRDELYREMEYRFRTVRKRGFELSIVGFVLLGPDDEFKANFRLKNTGECEARSPTVSIRLPSNVRGELPPEEETWSSGGMVAVNTAACDPFAISESRQDFFEPNGRVAIKEMGGINPLLMPGHSWDFEGLLFHLQDFPPGTTIDLDYRVDAEGLSTSIGRLSATVPSQPEDFLDDDDDDDDRS